MTVAELIDALSRFPEDAEVHSAHDYGDRSHTIVLPEIRYVNGVATKWSEYHRDLTIDDGDDEEYEDPDNEPGKEVVVISGFRI